MNRNTLFALVAVEMAIIAELMNNLVVVVDIETEMPNLDDYDDYDFPHTEQETIFDRAVVNEETFGEREIVDWLVTDCGLNVNKSASEYAPNEKMIALSVSEMAKIKREMDILKVRAEEGEELARKLDALHSEFFPSQE